MRHADRHMMCTPIGLMPQEHSLHEHVIVSNRTLIKNPASLALQYEFTLPRVQYVVPANLNYGSVDSHPFVATAHITANPQGHRRRAHHQRHRGREVEEAAFH